MDTDKLNLTEQDIQILLHRHINSGFCTPNSMVYGWESDLLHVRRSLWVTEYEIKLTTRDFRADSKKTYSFFNPEAENIYVLSKYDLLMDATRSRPNRMIYVCPQGVIPVEELPGFCGLIEVRPWGGPPWETLRDFECVTVKKSKVLHKDKIQVGDLYQIASSLEHRYWSVKRLLGEKK